jgi:hypothetical protein
MTSNLSERLKVLTIDSDDEIKPNVATNAFISQNINVYPDLYDNKIIIINCDYNYYEYVDIQKKWVEKKRKREKK